MPVEILIDNGGTTSTDDGTIQIGDLQSMSFEYQNHIALTAIPPRNSIAKRNCFYFTLDQLKALMDEYEDTDAANAIEIKLGVHVADTFVQCPGDPIPRDNSNCLAVVVSMANKDSKIPFNGVGDFVLINGYHPEAKFIEVAMCCPGTTPPPPNS